MSSAIRWLAVALTGPLLLGGSANRAGAQTSAAQSSDAPSVRTWTDPSPHQVRRVTVARDVQLEVLDWGGSGPVLVFLAGQGNTGHIFDTFAPRFRDRFHVYAITRRGVGYSSDPPDGYDAATRARDIVTVLDSLRVDRAVLAGHSIAGDELSKVGTTYPERVRALVYLEAYDYGPARRAAAEAVQMPEGLFPHVSAADTASPAAASAFWSRVVVGAPAPEAETRAVLTFGPDGVRTGTRGQNGGKIADGTEAADFRRISARALGLFATSPGGPAELFRTLNYAALDSATRVAADRFFAAIDARQKAGRDRFRAEIAHGTVVELPGAGHYVFLTQPERVEREMRSFLGECAKRVHRYRSSCLHKRSSRSRSSRLPANAVSIGD
jgi:pimeloyl-ACP methyl ester carboxylesterase